MADDATGDCPVMCWQFRHMDWCNHRLWQIKGTGMYFDTFWVCAESEAVALSKAKDILAGVGPDGKRFYDRADLEIMSVTEAHSGV